MKKRKGKKINQLIRKHLSAFQGVYKDDPFHRFASWEKCYSFFSKLRRNRRLVRRNTELANFHLGFYLASWGMYRGSSFLLKKSMDIHRQPIKEILNPNYDSLWNADPSCLKHPKTLDLLSELKSALNDLYLRQTRDTKTISDTLITKIMLGTLGCTPAYDRFFKKGCQKHNVRPYSNFSKRSIESLSEFYCEHSKTFESVSDKIKKDRRITYPPMKLIDMFFWSVGRGKDYH